MHGSLTAELVGLLKWKLKPDDVLTALQSVLNVEAEEIVKVCELYLLIYLFSALFSKTICMAMLGNQGYWLSPSSNVPLSFSSPKKLMTSLAHSGT